MSQSFWDTTLCVEIDDGFPFYDAAVAISCLSVGADRVMKRSSDIRRMS